MAVVNKRIGRHRLVALGVAVGSVSLLATGAAFTQTAGAVAPAKTPPSTCQLGNGASHVVEIGFDNVHFFRDNLWA